MIEASELMVGFADWTGLSIGLHAVARIGALGHPDPRIRNLPGRLEDLRRFEPLRNAIEAFWRQARNRRSESWVAHEDINTVMLATSLMPDGFLSLSLVAAGTPEADAEATADRNGVLK